VTKLDPGDVSAVVCTLNSTASIRRCLESLRTAGVGQIIVVDGGSHDGTREVAAELADIVLSDPGQGLGYARNVGIKHTTGRLVMNFGSDNVLPRRSLEKLIYHMAESGVQGTGSITRVDGRGYLARSMDAYRSVRFRAGRASVIGTPTLFDGELLRQSPFDPTRRYSDDTELCERWAKLFGAHFSIAPVEVLEIGKTTWSAIVDRCRIYGISDYEIYNAGRTSGWTWRRKVRSLAHPLVVDLVDPGRALWFRESVKRLPFLFAFTFLRYLFWFRAITTASSDRALGASNEQ